MNKEKKFEGEAHNFNPIERTGKTLTDQDYIDMRLDDQIQWHKRKSEWNASRFKLLKYVDTFVAALVPISIGVGSVFDTTDIPSDQDQYVVWITRIISALSGVYVAISAGFIELESFEINAKNFKRMYRKLEGYKYKYLSRTEPFDEDDAFGRLVFSVENELHQDVANFFNNNKNTNISDEDLEEPNSQI